MKYAEARRLRASGLTYAEVAGRLDVPPASVYRWLNPAYDERQKQNSREWKARNPERLHEYHVAYSDKSRATCEQCGQPAGKNTKGKVRRCMPCIKATSAARAHEIERLWREGQSLAAIAPAVGWSEGTLRAMINRFRRLGYDIPYRRQRKRPRFPEQV